jgi:hypothetical protein
MGVAPIVSAPVTRDPMEPKRFSSADLQRIADDIIAGMSLKEKSLIAHMDAESLPYLQYAFDIYISREIGDDDRWGPEIMRRVWQRLQGTHRIRLVK